ncbi:TPA: hypothetical protein N0F65_001365 [Lagenidium giganteum]|uniref:tRNA (guanine(46)-N(7))-methyltransferase n=1 Tax=Lagenidium giganteum TaxID=4803 RepID=A0AAV2YX50_9STRA|nr:TPA: hypothetical protein N0F65_001365 [Lagenidium giganteum]
MRSVTRWSELPRPVYGLTGVRSFSEEVPQGSRRFRQHVNPLSKQYREPITIPDWDAQLAQPQLPIHLDIGCARGKYLMELAQEKQGVTNFVGVEIRQNVVNDAIEEAQRLQLRNLVLLHANMNFQQHLLLPALPAPVQSVSIFHPDPWMKKKHIKRRLVTPEFVKELASLLPDKTPVYVQTDVLELFEFMTEIFEASGCYSTHELPENPFGLPTDREKFVMGQGGDIYRVAYHVQH